MSLLVKIKNLFQKTQKSFFNIKDTINYYSQNKNIVNYILYANGCFIGLFLIMIFFLQQQTISNYFNIRETIGHIKEVSDGYELEFTKVQVTLYPNTNKINSIIKNVKKYGNTISGITSNINDTEYKKLINNYTKMLNKRVLIHNEIIHQYTQLVKIYTDYTVIAANAENAIADNLKLQLQIKHLMLNLEKIRLMTKESNREKILNEIHEYRNQLIYESPKIQEKVGLFFDTTESIVKLLRYLDTIRSSMDNDGYYDTMKKLSTVTSEKIDTEKLKFSLRLIAFLFLSIVMVSIQFIVLTLFFINKKRTEKLQKEAIDKIQKSQEIADRAKQYALDAQRSQFQLLHNFCADFDIIIASISKLTRVLKKQATDTNITDFYDNNHASVKNQNISIVRLDASVIALEKWLNNYLEIYTPKDKWEDLTETTINFTELFDKNFAEARFFMHERQHLLSIFHDHYGGDIVSDKSYLFKLFINMIYVSVKWAENTWVKSSIILEEKADFGNNDSHKTHLLTVSLINGASEKKYQEGLDLFQQEHELATTHNDDANHQAKDDNDNNRFVIAAMYYMKQICDILSADFSFERNIMDENMLKIKIPVRLSEDSNDNISVPILKNKNVLIVSPYPLVLRNMSDQLSQFGLNVTALSDKYSAIGHIVGKNTQEKNYDLFIIEHNPPDIDAESLTKIIRENSSKNLTHIIITTTEEHALEVEYNKSMYDAIFIKPIMPMMLKKKLEEFIEIQLYGTSSQEGSDAVVDNDIQKLRHEDDICRFLAIMDEDLSSMLLQLVLTKANYKVDIVTSPATLYELLEEHTYNFILTSNKCNWIIPENLSNDIRRHHTDNKDSVIIMIYDTLKDSVIKKLGRAGYDDFIQLPLSRSVFMDTINSWSDPIEKRMQINNKSKLAKKSKNTIETQEEAEIETKTLDTDNSNSNSEQKTSGE